MTFQKSRILLGIIFGVIKLVVKLFYKFLKILHLRLTFLLGIVGIVLYFTSPWNYTYVRVIYFVALGLSVVLAVVLIAKKSGGKK